MPGVDWTPERETHRAGIYYAEIAKAENRTAKTTGVAMFGVQIKAVDFDDLLCFHNILLGGKGRNMGQKQLQALGFTEERDSIEPHELVGKRFYCAVSETIYNGKPKNEIDVGGSPYCGFWPEGEKPEHVELPEDSEPAPWDE